jgi:RNA polymerase sigma factor (sigma-70 family)
MPDNNERYWDDLDIDDKFRKILDDEEDELKKENNKFYKFTRSADNMGEELTYLLNSIKGNSLKSNNENSEIFQKSSRLNYAIKCLTDKQRTAVELYFFSRRTQQEIAEIMGCKQRNVSDLISRAVKQIAKKLTK